MRGKIAVLMTSYNRKAFTLKSLDKILSISADCEIFLVDDGSKDGTFDAIKQNFPQVSLIYGSGDLYWNRGMHLAWLEASKFDYDFYLWLNDDVFLYEDAINELLFCSSQWDNKAIVSGLVESKDCNQILYGGSDRNGLIKPNGKMNPIQNLNGNVVLVPKNVFKLLGNLDPYYHHDLGDVDYGLRAKKVGIEVLTTTKPIASGTKNPIVRVRKSGVSLKKRFQILRSPLGAPPKFNFYFRRRHYGFVNALCFNIHLYFLNILPDFAVSLIYGNKYD